MTSGLWVLVVIVVLCGECKTQQAYTTTHSTPESEPMYTNNEEETDEEQIHLFWEPKAWSDWYEFKEVIDKNRRCSMGSNNECDAKKKGSSCTHVYMDADYLCQCNNATQIDLGNRCAEKCTASGPGACVNANEECQMDDNYADMFCGCNSNSFMDKGMCTQKQPVGVLCGRGYECESGQCYDGMCVCRKEQHHDGTVCGEKTVLTEGDPCGMPDTICERQNLTCMDSVCRCKEGLAKWQGGCHSIEERADVTMGNGFDGFKLMIPMDRKVVVLDLDLDNPDIQPFDINYQGMVPLNNVVILFQFGEDSISLNIAEVNYGAEIMKDSNNNIYASIDNIRKCGAVTSVITVSDNMMQEYVKFYVPAVLPCDSGDIGIAFSPGVQPTTHPTYRPGDLLSTIVSQITMTNKNGNNDIRSTVEQSPRFVAITIAKKSVAARKRRSSMYETRKPVAVITTVKMSEGIPVGSSIPKDVGTAILPNVAFTDAAEICAEVDALQMDKNMNDRVCFQVHIQNEMPELPCMIESNPFVSGHEAFSSIERLMDHTHYTGDMGEDYTQTYRIDSTRLSGFMEANDHQTYSGVNLIKAAKKMLPALTSEMCTDILDWKDEIYQPAEADMNYNTYTDDSVEQLLDNTHSHISSWSIREQLKKLKDNMDSLCWNEFETMQCAVNQAMFNVLLLKSKENGARLGAMAMCPAINYFFENFDNGFHVNRDQIRHYYYYLKTIAVIFKKERQYNPLRKLLPKLKEFVDDTSMGSGYSGHFLYNECDWLKNADVLYYMLSIRRECAARTGDDGKYVIKPLKRKEQCWNAYLSHWLSRGGRQFTYLRGLRESIDAENVNSECPEAHPLTMRNLPQMFWKVTSEGQIMAGTQTINGESVVWSLIGVCTCPSKQCATTTHDYSSSDPYMHASTSSGYMGSWSSSTPPMGGSSPMGASPTGGSNPEPTPDMGLP